MGRRNDAANTVDTIRRTTTANNEAAAHAKTADFSGCLSEVENCFVCLRNLDSRFGIAAMRV